VLYSGQIIATFCVANNNTRLPFHSKSVDHNEDISLPALRLLSGYRTGEGQRH
jgi:hypothetical protein